MARGVGALGLAHVGQVADSVDGGVTRHLHGRLDPDRAVGVHNGLVLAADQEPGVGACAVALEPEVGLDDLALLSFDHEVREVADVLRGQVGQLGAGDDANAEGGQLLADLIT